MTILKNTEIKMFLKKIFRIPIHTNFQIKQAQCSSKFLFYCHCISATFIVFQSFSNKSFFKIYLNFISTLVLLLS